ncbi:histone acetylation protein-domain-containing protein [Geranomyces variabilis]|nr:histone acetylation protein-domain-containing protein [Geranomyces variabilis]KAJ3140786.1 hypothetical protein HDU90_008091 [Geranomyces variabilis]
MTSPVTTATPAPSPSRASSSSLDARLFATLPAGLRQQLQLPLAFQIFTLSSPPRNAASVLPNCPDAVATDRLLLLAQASSMSSPPSSNPAVFISALRVTEYATPAQTHIHIAKLDTSGHHTNASLARALAAAYISHATAAAFSSSVTSTITIHVFARAQPAYLFPGSEHNTAKHALSDRALLKWWAGTLVAAVATTAAASATAHLYVPGETTRSMRDVWAACCSAPTATAISAPPIAWEWGLAPCASNAGGAANARAVLADQRARDVVVRFPDDARTKVLESHADADTTVAELQDMLALTGECNGRLSGFFQVELRGCEQKTSTDKSSAPSPSSSWPGMTREAFEAAERFLMGLEFARLEDAVRSSRLLEEHLTSSGITPMNIDVHPAPAHTKSLQQHSSPVMSSDKCKQPADDAEPAVIQSLVKRKEAPATKSVQGLVKRAKPSMGAEPALVQNLVKRKATAVSNTIAQTSAK